MQNGPKNKMNSHRPKSARLFTNRSKQWTSNVGRPEARALKTRKETISVISR